MPPRSRYTSTSRADPRNTARMYTLERDVKPVRDSASLAPWATGSRPNRRRCGGHAGCTGRGADYLDPGRGRQRGDRGRPAFRDRPGRASDRNRAAGCETVHRALVRSSVAPAPGARLEAGNLVALLRSLGPGVMRFGGFTADTSTAFAVHRPAPDWATT